MSEQKESTDISWVLDSLVGFLKGPVWNLPILNFIEKKSVIFEPEETSEVLEQEYSAIFNEFKDLVDKLLASHMQDLEINPTQFENACLSAHENLSAKFHAILFEQIWAASNYRIFKRMMIQRNIDLQLQALELLGQKMQLNDTTLDASSLSARGSICEEEDELMKEILRRSAEKHNLKDSKDDDSNKQPTTSNEDLQLEKKLKESVKLAEKAAEENILVDYKEPIIDKVLTFQNSINSSSSSSRPDSASLLEINNRKLSLIIGKKSNEISAEELEKRQNYLRNQRDKLIELKRKERSKQIAKVGESELKASRPKSAKAIKATIEKSDEEMPSSPTKDDKGLVYRRTLAARLKAELIGTGSLGEGSEEKKIISDE